MKSIKRKLIGVVMVIMLIVITAVILLESRSHSVKSSSVFTTAKQTEIHLYVVMNTLFSVDETKVAEEIITEHQKINGTKENTVYTLKLYRTFFHYRRNWDYDTIICDENGAIICCGED